MLRKKLSQPLTGFHADVFIIIKILGRDNSSQVLVYLYMFDIHTGKTLYRAKITTYTVFITCAQESTGAMFGITGRSGKAFRVQINGQALFPYRNRNSVYYFIVYAELL